MRDRLDSPGLWFIIAVVIIALTLATVFQASISTTGGAKTGAQSFHIPEDAEERFNRFYGAFIYCVGRSDVQSHSSEMCAIFAQSYAVPLGGQNDGK